jgi:GNAT superfamily N-acetyltransferase
MQLYKLDTTRRREVNTFVRFPFELYRNCPQWVPPLRPDMRLALNRDRYPFYRDSEADFFVVQDKGQTLGRIAVLENRPYNQYHDSKAAFFYYFEAIDDAGVAHALFDAAFDWARQRGLNTIFGPKGLLRADANGLLVQGFEHRPAFGVAYNYDYYDRLLREAGFAQELDYFSGYLSTDHQVPERIMSIAERIRERRGFQVQTFTSKRQLHQLAPALLRVYQKAFVQVWGYYPISEQEIETLLKRITTIADPRLIKVVTKKEEPIGFVIAYPDISAAIQRTKGRLWPLGWAQLLAEARRTEWVNFNGAGILPEYQGMGANAVLYAEMVKTFRHANFNFKHADYVQVAENNAQSLGDANALGLSWYKTHRIYKRTL